MERIHINCCRVEQPMTFELEEAFEEPDSNSEACSDGE